MSDNQNTRGIDHAVDRNGACVWNRLHSEREDICEALLKEFRTGFEVQTGFARILKADATDAENWHRELLQVRLGKIDDALDRLMAGSYGNCCKCDRWIEDTKLDFDPAIAFCIECWQRIQTKH